MSDSDEQRLLVAVEARIRDFERNMQRAERTGTNSFTNLRRSSASATRQMEEDMRRSTTRVNQSLGTTSSKIGAFGKAMLAGFNPAAAAAAAAAIAFSLAIAGTNAALDEFGDIADKSAQAGLDPEFFQGLTYQASLAGVEMKELSSSLNGFAKDAGLAAIGKGKMLSALQKLNPALLENIRNAKNQEERVKLAADAIDKAGTASAKAALATTLFGSAGAALVPVFSGGADAIERTAAKARELGIIVDREVIARADELGDEFATATKIMDIEFKKAMVDLAPILLETARIASTVARAIGDIVDAMRDVENQSTRGLTIKQGDLMAQKATLAAQMQEIQSKGLEEYGQEYVDTAIKPLKDQLKHLDDQENEVIAQLQARSPFNPKNRTGSSDTGDGDDTTKPDLPSTSRKDAADDAVRQAEAVKELISNLEFERSLVGKSEVEQAQMNALRQAGAAATDEQKARIKDLIAETARENAAIAATSEMLQLQKDIVGGLATDIRSAFEDGKISAQEWGDVLGNVLDKIADKLQSLIIDQAFGSGGFNLLGLLGGSLVKGVSGGSALAGVAGANPVAKAALPNGAMAPASGRSGDQSGLHITWDFEEDAGGNIVPQITKIVHGEMVKNGPKLAKGAIDDYRRGQLKNDVGYMLGRPKRNIR